MNVELSERDNDADKQERRERIKESRYNMKYEMCMTEGEYLGRERVEKKEKLWRDLDVETRREKTEIGRKERKEGAGMCYEEREATEHMWNGRSEMRERGRERNWKKYRMKTEGR
jgi:hypothetical protein